MHLVRIGDSVAVGPFYAQLSDGTVIDLTGAKIWCSVATTRTASPVFTKKNAAGGGSDDVVETTDLTTGEFYVYFLTTDTANLVNDTTYYLDARVTTTDGGVYTVGEATFKAVDPYTAVPS